MAKKGKDKQPKWRREQINRFIRRGDWLVVVPVEIVYPDPNCYIGYCEESVLDFLDEVGRRLEAQDMDYLESVGKVYRKIGG